MMTAPARPRTHNAHKQRALQGREAKLHTSKEAAARKLYASLLGHVDLARLQSLSNRYQCRAHNTRTDSHGVENCTDALYSAIPFDYQFASPCPKKPGYCPWQRILARGTAEQEAAQQLTLSMLLADSR